VTAMAMQSAGDADRIRQLIRAMASAREALCAELGSEVEAVVDPDSGATILLRSGQESLVQSEAHHVELSIILENVRDSVVVLDRDRRVTFWNHGATALFGYTRAEMIGETLAALHPETPEEVVAEELGAVWRGEERRWVRPCRRKDGQGLWIDVRSAAVRDRDGIVTGMLLVATDVTDQKRLEAELRFATAQAESANRAKSEFLANMSHEIRTPMNAIIGMTDIVLDSELSADHRHSLELVRQSSEALLDIINDILDFSKIEAGKLALQSVAFDLHEELAQPLDALAVRAHQKGLEVVSHVEPAVPTAMVGDPCRLRQVLINLVGNAIKFCDAGEVAVSVAVVPDDQPGPLLHFRIRDSGIGIPLDKQAVIFRAFEQADGSSTRRYGGTGLGLTISASLVALMGGRIWVESEEGGGSTFHFTARFAPPAAGGAALLPSVDLAGLRALVVDDNRTCREALVASLTALGADCQAVESAAAARAVLTGDDGRPVHLLFVDATLPGEDGWSLVRWCAERPDLAWGGRLVLGTSLDGDGVRRAAAVGAGYLAKPIATPALLAALRQLVEGVTVAAPAPSAPVATRGLRVLVAEDQEVNQELICRLLSRAGHTVALANNGREAVDRWRRERFDLVLMDMQMPIMDGLEAAAAIRDGERGSGEHIPIVALTAHAMHTDEVRCLAAGMDAYLSKPLHNRELLALLHRVAAGGPLAPALPLRAEPELAAGDAPIDVSRCLEIVGGQASLLASLATTFLRGLDGRVAALREALAQADAGQVLFVAHSLKGSLTNFAARQAVVLARRLEEAAATGDLTDAAPTLAALVDELARVRAAVERLADLPHAA